MEPPPPTFLASSSTSCSSLLRDTSVIADRLESLRYMDGPQAVFDQKWAWPTAKVGVFFQIHLRIAWSHIWKSLYQILDLPLFMKETWLELSIRLVIYAQHYSYFCQKLGMAFCIYAPDNRNLENS